MRLKTTAGFSAPLLISTFATILAGCPTGTAQQDKSTPPTVTAVYAVDQQGDGLPDVALFLANDPYSKGGARVSPKAPASYTGFRVEVDQALQGTSIEGTNGGQETLAADLPGPLGGFTACVNATTVSFIDVDGTPAGGGAPAIPAGTAIPASICYNPSTIVGSNPHVDVYVGADAAATDVFTCQQFHNNAGDLGVNHKYAIKFGSAITGSNGKALTLPSSTGWSSGTYTFTTSDFDLLATSYIDASTGYTHFLNKTAAGLGFLKDLDAEDAATYRQPPTGDPIYIFFSDFVAESTTAGDPLLGTPLVATGDGNPAVTVTRTKDGSPFTTIVALDSEIGFNYGDPRVIDVIPNLGGLSGSGGTWEPGVQYTITINPTILSADSGNPLGGSAITYTFTAGAADLGVIHQNPVPNQTGVVYTLNANASNVGYYLTYQAPIDATTITTDNIKMTDSSGNAIPLKFGLPSGSRNFQRVVIRPTDASGNLIFLKPSTTYTITAQNLKVAAKPQELAGQTFAPFTNTFKTISFELGGAPGQASNGGAGVTAAKHPGQAALTDFNQVGSHFNASGNIERVLTQSPVLVGNGAINVSFLDTPTGVSTSSLHLSELTGGTATEITGTTLTQGVSGVNQVFSLAAPASYKVKCGQQYQVKADQTITDPNGVKLSLEGCSSGDCSDPRVFGTRNPTLQIVPDLDGNGQDTGSFTLYFWRPSRQDDPSPSRRRIDQGIPADMASVNPQLPTSASDTAKAVRLYKAGAGGALTQVGVACTPATSNPVLSVHCAPTDAVTPNAPYVATAVFTKSAPVTPNATMVDYSGGATTVQLDSASCSFVGAVTSSFTTACAATP